MKKSDNGTKIDLDCVGCYVTLSCLEKLYSYSRFRQTGYLSEELFCGEM